MRDLADVIELIKALGLSADSADALNPFVQDKYRQLREDAHPPAKRYVAPWRNQRLRARAKSLEDMLAGLKSAADTLRSMLADGVTLDPQGGTSDDHVCFCAMSRPSSVANGHNARHEAKMECISLTPCVRDGHHSRMFHLKSSVK